jgi:2,4-dienoyl-CoA reductase-like NADH-dependent reductase (Old Yellow Enzyme family)
MPMQGLFDPFSLKSLELKNRMVMLPMCMYMGGSDGKAAPWHQVHYASRAAGGCGLIIQEAVPKPYWDAYPPEIRSIIRNEPMNQ